MLMYKAIAWPNRNVSSKGLSDHIRIILPKNRSHDLISLRFLGYLVNISSLTGFKGGPIIQYVPPPLSLVDGLFVMLAAVLEVKGSYAFRASPSRGCRNGSEGRDWCAYGRMIWNDPRRSNTHRMNRTLKLVSALGAGLFTVAGMAQTTTPSTQPAAVAVAPHAEPAKIALIEYEQVAAATNEGQRAIQEIQAKYAPKKTQMDSEAAEVDSLKKQLQSAPATLSDEERSSKLRTIDTKEKELQRDAQDAQQAYNADLQDALGKVAQKLGPTVVKYVKDNGYTLLLDLSGQQAQGGVSVMWATPGTDISQAVIEAYNTSSGVSAPAPSAPTPAARPRSATRPATKK
jgi:outer membrane protein